MFVTFRDSLGSVCVETDKYGVSFDSSTGKAIFGSEDEETGETTDYRIPVEDLISISESEI